MQVFDFSFYLTIDNEKTIMICKFRVCLKIEDKMRKTLFFIIITIFTLNSTEAADMKLVDNAVYQKNIMQIGYRLLNANNIDKRMTFMYVPEKKVNAYSCATTKNIVLNRGLMGYIENDDELAAVLSHQISHSVEQNSGILRRFAHIISSKRSEEKADENGVDMMVNAGYNPVSMIIVLNKVLAENNFSSIAVTKRLMHVYEYIYENYPAYLADNEYQSNPYYQNFLLGTKKERECVRRKYSNLYSDK